MKTDISIRPAQGPASHAKTLPGLLGAALLVVTLQSQAQAPQPAASSPAAAASSPQPSPSTMAATSTSTTASLPKYSAQDLDRAFAFMDGNKDGKVSKDESQNFRGVYRHFDEADTNKDGFMSREEFENAMNKAAAK